MKVDREKGIGSHILSDTLEERVSHFSLCGLRSVFDFGQQFGFNPYAAVRDALGVRLRLADQRREPFTEFGGRSLIEAMVDLTGINQIGALAPADIDPVPFVAVEREAGDGQRLALRAGFLDPVIAAAEA